MSKRRFEVCFRLFLKPFVISCDCLSFRLEGICYNESSLCLENKLGIVLNEVKTMSDAITCLMFLETFTTLQYIFAVGRLHCEDSSYFEVASIIMRNIFYFLKVPSDLFDMLCRENAY